MKTKIVILVFALSAIYFNLHAQERVRTTTRAASYDISDNLDLDAVSSIFADSKNLEDFEFRLNDPDNRISNLDLNRDGYVDYLRVMETTNDRNSLVVIQSVLDQDVYQDVATIEIERVPDGRHRIQVVGDPWIYGPNYIIEPVFVRSPLIFSFFWGPRYTIWHSPFYWGHYPRWFYSYKPYPTHRYYRHVNIYVDRRVTFNRISQRQFNINDNNFNTIRRRDFADRHPNNSYENRRRGSSNTEGQIRNQPTRRSDSQPTRRITNGTNDRSNESIRRDVDRSREIRNSERSREGQSNGRISQPSQGQPRREYSRPSQSTQRTQTIEQRAPQSRPDSRENFRRRIDNSSSEKSRTIIQERNRFRNDIKSSAPNTPATPATPRTQSAPSTPKTQSAPSAPRTQPTRTEEKTEEKTDNNGRRR